MVSKSISKMLRQLSPDEIRQRLADIDAEARALRTLLRAALKIRSAKANQKSLGIRDA